METQTSIENDLATLPTKHGYPNLRERDFAKRCSVLYKNCTETRIPKNHTFSNEPTDSLRGYGLKIMGVITSPSELQGMYLFEVFEGLKHPILLVKKEDLI